jgi:diamine N-acetyltransferase
MSNDVSLVEITQATVDVVLRLAVTPEQARFVAPNAVSLAQAHFEPGAWFRAIAHADDLVGFAMIFDPTLPGAVPWPDLDTRTIMLWRFMIDHASQRHGIGAAAIARLAEHARTRPVITRFATSYSEGPGGPADFYRRTGFVATGRLLEDEAEAVMHL